MRKKPVNLRKLILMLLLTPFMGLLAQQAIQGKVVDDKSGDPLIGVSVTIRGTSTGTVTDFDGNFTISIQKEETLNLTYVGYQPQSLQVNPRTREGRILVKMKELSQELDEVVIVGYGTQKKASSVASIVQTKGEEMLKVGNLNSVSEALQGKLNGVITINNNAKPGANAAEIYIRGKASWGSTSPLTLVDGVERNINDVDMNEIESISVLKDASATAVYGVKGANGVILITSRRGENRKPQVNFSTNLGIKQFTTNVNFADYLSSMQTYNTAVANEKDWAKQFPRSTMDAWRNAYATGNYGPYNDVFPEVNWFDELVRDYGISQNYNLNINGGNDFISYFVSVGYQEDGDNYKIEKQEDFDPRYWFKRYNWRSNLDFKLTKTTKLSFKIAGKMAYQNEPTGANETRELFTPILQAPTNVFPIKYSDGSWGEGKQLGYNILANVSTRGQELNKTFQGWYDLELEQKLDFITKGLSAKAKLAYNSYSTNNTRIRAGQIFGANEFESQSYAVYRINREYDYTNPTINADGSITYPMLSQIIHPSADAVGNYPVGVSYDNFGDYGRKLYYELSVDYKRSFGNHNITALALFNRRVNDYAGGNRLFNFPEYSEDWVGRVTYNYKERYLSEVNMAYNGSEKFAPGKRFGFFPSVSVGWRISEEPLIKQMDEDGIISNFKVRYSYGQVGSDANSPRFNYIQLYNTGGNTNYGYTQNVGFGPVYYEGTVANINSTWETATKQNLGIEFGLWHKLNINLDLFDEYRTGMLMTRRTMASWFAANLPSVNIGETKNHGLELEIGWNDKVNKDFSYNINFNFSTSENRITYRDDPTDLVNHLKDAGKPIGYQSRYLATGNYGSIDDLYNYAQTSLSGITPGQMIPGDLVYVDYNGDGVINVNDQVVVNQLNYPLTTFSLNLGFKYKEFGFSMLLYAPKGIYKNLPDTYLWDFPMSNIKAQPNASESWTPQTANSEGVIRPALRILTAHNGVSSTYSYRDYSYVRLKNLEMNYNIPKKILKSVNINNCQFYINGNNILTLSKLDKRIDPETGGSGSYPIVRTYTTGVRVSF